MDLRHAWLALLLLLASLPAVAATVVRVVGPEPAAAEVAAGIARGLPALDVRRDGAPADIVVAVGARAYREAVAVAGARVVGIAMTRHGALQAGNAGPGSATVLYWEPDPLLQLQFARRLMPGARRVGVLLGSDQGGLGDALRAEARRLGMECVVVTVASAGEFQRQLNAVLAGSDFLLAVEDSLVSSPVHAKTLLLTSYRHDKPVIGPNAAYVDAGSVASLATGMSATIDSLVQWLPELLASPALPPPRHAQATAVVTNPRVARSLQLSLPPVAGLDAWLRGQGENP